MGAALGIRTDLASPARLRALARRERNPRTATRMLAIAGALEGEGRAEAARLAGMERQALRDAVLRYNAEGPEGPSRTWGVLCPGLGVAGRGRDAVADGAGVGRARRYAAVARGRLWRALSSGLGLPTRCQALGR